MQRPLAAIDRVGVTRRDPERLAAAMQQHTAVRRDDAAAEIAEQGIDEGNREAVLVDHGQVDRVGLWRQRASPEWSVIRFSSETDLRQLVDIIGADQAGVADIHMTRDR